MTKALEVQGLSKAFGGVVAIDDLSFDVRQGDVHAMIGPNGAGKTTLVNMLTGIYAPDAGRFALFGQEAARLQPEELARQGLSRTFQNLQICMNLGALENVMIGEHRHLNSSLLAGLAGSKAMRSADAECRQRARELMAFVGVESFVDHHASQLPYGAMKRLEIARALAARPRLLLMDEPAAGLNHTETREIADLIRKVADSGVTVVLVEHDMHLVMSVSDQILVLHHGRRLSLGSRNDVRNDPLVIEAYLGKSA